MPLYKACIFDMDGTLLNTLSTIAHFGNQTLAAYHFPTFPEERYKAFVGNGAKILIHRMLAASGKDTEENFNRVYPTYIAAYENDYAYLTHPYDGIPELLEKLQKSGIPAAVLSNKPEVAAKRVCAKMFSENLLFACMGQSDRFPIKPDPAAALYLAKEMGASPEECLYIGDTCVDMDTGHAAGMPTVGVLWGFRDKDELVRHHADYIVTSPQEIADILHI